MQARKYSWMVALAMLIVGPRTAAAEPTAAESEYFEKQVRPIFVSRCYECHSEDSVEGDLRVDSLAGLLRGGKRGAAIVPGKPEKSLLVFAINHATQLDMPPKEKLPVAEIAALTRWVKMGAPWPNAKPLAEPAVGTTVDEIEITAEHRKFWSFHPPALAALPTVRQKDWPLSPIDYFVLSRLEQAGLKPAPPASRRTWLRRVTFDLTGLPPTVAQMERFLQDNLPDAEQRVVDRLLAAPAYGERWGRQWLDVARYADSNGLDENLAYANAYHYRDYVVQAFNKDKPFDHFVMEQLAGDVLTEQDSDASLGERITATGFLVLGAKMLAEDDPVKMQMDIIDEQLDAIGKAFMGLSLGCARCHNHKFDPISMSDYYGMAGILKSTKTMENFKVVARWQERPVESLQGMQQRETRERQIVEAEAEIQEIKRTAAQSQRGQARRQVADYLVAGQQLKELTRWLPDHITHGNHLEDSVPASSLLIEAEAYQRGNVLKDTTQYGKSIGVLVNQGQVPNFTEYDIELAEEGWYQLDVRYAAEDSRPTKLFIDGTLVREDLAGGVTGSWLPDTQTWSVAGLFHFTAGKHLLRLEQPRFFPHIDKLMLVRLSPSLSPAKEVKSLVAETSQSLPELLDLGQAISWEAETFHRGNVVRLATGYGVGIGVIAGPGGLNWAEMDIHVPSEGAYHLAIRYAAAEARSTRLMVNSQLVNSSVTDQVTGSWYPDTQKWFIEGTYHLPKGKTTIRIERDGPIPHIDRIFFVPGYHVQQMEKTAGLVASTSAGFVQQWQDYLKQQREDQDSIFAAWFHALDGKAYQPNNPLSQLVQQRLVDQGKPATALQWAHQYQRLFTLAETRWQKVKTQAKGLEDPVLEAFRQVLYDEQGPFAIVDGTNYGVPADRRQRLSQLVVTRDQLKAVMKTSLTAMAVSEGTPEDLQVHLRGSHITLGRKVPRRFLQVISGREQPPLEAKESGRLQLARWLVSDEHPLTSRVMVNRVWQGHFGTGLVRSPDNFGRLGKLPTHPLLLDYLSLQLKRDQWSLKTLHRRIVLSATYRMSSVNNKEAAELDPENKLYWRMNRRRLEAEAIRDAVLAIGGNLDRRMGGTELLSKNRAYVTSTANVNPVVYQNNRRSIYLPVVRSALFEMFQVFDFADPSVLNGKRQSTTIAPQALFMMNSKMVVEECQGLANQLLAATAWTDRQRVQQLFQLVYARPPGETELYDSLDYLARYQGVLADQQVAEKERQQRAWQSLCHALMVASEFIYVE